MIGHLKINEGPFSTRAHTRHPPQLDRNDRAFVVLCRKPPPLYYVECGQKKIAWLNKSVCVYVALVVFEVGIMGKSRFRPQNVITSDKDRKDDQLDNNSIYGKITFLPALARTYNAGLSFDLLFFLGRTHCCIIVQFHQTACARCCCCPDRFKLVFSPISPCFHYLQADRFKLVQLFLGRPIPQFIASFYANAGKDWSDFQSCLRMELYEIRFKKPLY
jgi:hypothetical protein